jgi:hypothetical protein
VPDSLPMLERERTPVGPLRHPDQEGAGCLVEEVVFSLGSRDKACNMWSRVESVVPCAIGCPVCACAIVCTEPPPTNPTKCYSAPCHVRVADHHERSFSFKLQQRTNTKRCAGQFRFVFLCKIETESKLKRVRSQGLGARGCSPNAVACWILKFEFWMGAEVSMSSAGCTCAGTKVGTKVGRRCHK